MEIPFFLMSVCLFALGFGKLWLFQVALRIMTELSFFVFEMPLMKVYCVPIVCIRFFASVYLFFPFRYSWNAVFRLSNSFFVHFGLHGEKVMFFLLVGCEENQSTRWPIISAFFVDPKFTFTNFYLFLIVLNGYDIRTQNSRIENNSKQNSNLIIIIIIIRHAEFM